MCVIKMIERFCLFCIKTLKSVLIKKYYTTKRNYFNSLVNSFIYQDKSSCIAPQTIKYLIGDDDDVIHVNVGSGVTTAHISSLMSSSSGHIWAFGANKGTAVNRTMEKFNVKSILLK